MASTIIMPQLGETVAEGKILAWFKSVGDEIKEGDDLFEVETDKVTIEVQAIVAGRLSEIRVGPGATAKVGEVVAVVGDGAATNASTRGDVPAAKGAPWRSPFEEVSTPTDRFGPAKGPNGIHMTPLARRLMVQHGLDLAVLAKDADRRSVKKIDGATVRAAIATHLASPAPPAAIEPPIRSEPPVQESDVITLNAMRRKTGERLAESWRTIPHVFQAIEVDFTAIDLVRKRRREAFQKAYGFSLTYLPFVARATCLAIVAFPQVNARFDGNALALSQDVNLGIAVDLDHNGLIVPVRARRG